MPSFPNQVLLLLCVRVSVFVYLPRRRVNPVSRVLYTRHARMAISKQSRPSLPISFLLAVAFYQAVCLNRVQVLLVPTHPGPRPWADLGARLDLPACSRISLAEKK